MTTANPEDTQYLAPPARPGTPRHAAWQEVMRILAAEPEGAEASLLENLLIGHWVEEAIATPADAVAASAAWKSGRATIALPPGRRRRQPPSLRRRHRAAA